MSDIKFLKKDKKWGIGKDGFLTDMETGERCSGKVYNPVTSLDEDVLELNLPADYMDCFRIDIPDGTIWINKGDISTRFGKVNLWYFGDTDPEEKVLFESLKTKALSGSKESAVELLKKLAASFYIKSEIDETDFQCWSPGQLYFAIAGFLCDMRLSFQFFQAGAFRGNPECQEQLALCLENGTGVKKNEKLALKWYKKAALNGNTSAMSRISQFYLWNQNVCVIDFHKSFYWLKKSAEKGWIWDYPRLADWYLNGIDIAKNKQKALYWSNKISRLPSEKRKNI